MTASEDRATIERTVLAADLARWQALKAGDFDSIAAMVTADLAYTFANGKIETREQYLHGLRTGGAHYPSLERVEAVAHSRGGVAWVSGRVQLEVVRGTDRHPSDNSFLTVWVEEDGAWKMAAYHVTRYTA